MTRGGLLALLMTVVCSTTLEARGDLSVKFGELGRDAGGNIVVIDETTQIPYRIEGPWNGRYLFGFIVEATTATPFQGYVVNHLPSPPAQLTEELKGASTQAEGTVIKGPEKTYSKRWVKGLALDAGDPHGDYKIEIFVDGVLFREIRFQVQSPK